MIGFYNYSVILTYIGLVSSVFGITQVFENHMSIAFLCLLLSGICDLFDGKIARKHNLVTTFGKFLDPLADKLLVMTALICFTFERWIDPVAVVLILAREFMVTGLRLVVASEGVVVAAGIWGKLKTAFTMVALIAIMVFADR